MKKQQHLRKSLHTGHGPATGSNVFITWHASIESVFGRGSGLRRFRRETPTAELERIRLRMPKIKIMNFERLSKRLQQSFFFKGQTILYDMAPKGMDIRWWEVITYFPPRFWSPRSCGQSGPTLEEFGWFNPRIESCELMGPWWAKLDPQIVRFCSGPCLEGWSEPLSRTVLERIWLQGMLMLSF